MEKLDHVKLIADFHFDRIPDQTGRIRPGDVGVAHSIFRSKPEDVPPADLEAWSEYLAAWHVPKPVEIKLSAVPNGRMVFMLMEAFQDDAAGLLYLPDQVHLRIEIMVPTPRPDENSARWVRALLRWLVLHELDEYTKVAGQRVFDPHRGGRTPTPENS